MQSSAPDWRRPKAWPCGRGRGVRKIQIMTWHPSLCRAKHCPMAQIKFQHALLDAVQWLFGTNPSLHDISDSYATAHLNGTHAIPTGGVTFFDLFAKKGGNKWDEVETLIAHFRDLGVQQSALIRSDFLFGYEPRPYDVFRALVFGYAAMGMNVLQNFHGPNESRSLGSVAQSVAGVQAPAAGITTTGRRRAVVRWQNE